MESREVREAADVLTNQLSLACGSVVGSEGVEFVLGVPPQDGTAAERDESRACVRNGKVYLWGDDSVLEGSSHRKGTLMAVSGFLEDRIGVRWAWPGVEGAVFTHTHDISLPEGWSWRHVPPFGLQTFRTSSPRRFMRRSGTTPVEFHRAPDDMTNTWRDCVQWVGLMRLQTRKIFPYRHAFTGWQRRFLKTHPEYLALTGEGRRGMRPDQAQYVKLCVSNPQVVDQIIADWKANGTSEYINICPNDYNRGFCTCPNCRKLDVEPYKGGPEGNLTDRYVNFWNRIVEKARVIRPDVKAVTYIYSLYKTPPRRERIAYPDNMIFGMVPLLTDDLPSHIAGWKAAGMKSFFLRPNWLNYRAAPMRGLERILYENFKEAVDAGALGFDFDNGLHAPQINLERYVAGRLLSRPDLPFERICEEYYSAYGAAAPAVRRWHECLRERSEEALDRLREAVRGQVPKADDSQYSNVLALTVPLDEMARHEKLLCEARHQVASMLSPIEMKRIDDLILRLAHDRLTRRFMEAKDDEQSLRKFGEELLSFRLRHRDALNCNWCDVFSDDYTERALWKKSRTISGRIVTDLSGSGWTFDGEPASVPHTWNAKDGADGIGPRCGTSASALSYLRRRGTYRRALPAVCREGRRQFIRCQGAAQKATVRVNGMEIGRHVGSYTAFAFEATKYLAPSNNVLEIEVDNFVDPDVQPSGADFTVYGGLYRGVELIETDRICIDCVTDGADGVVLDADADTGEVVARVSVDGGTNEIYRFSFPNRELWSPENPKLYEIAVTVAQGGCVDTVRKTFGFRKAEFREDGFYLNGVKRKIRGVNMHADLDGYGWALPQGQRARDIATVKEMGADGIRTAHYPHADETYLECDRQGLVAWCEYPNVGMFTPTEAYRRNALHGIREMVAQLRHHPSIVVWSVSNEYKTNSTVTTAWVERLLGEFSAEVKRLDPSRSSSAATFQAFQTGPNSITDVLGFNFYPGWYRRTADEMRETIDDALRVTDRKMIGVTEYGAGGNADCHESAEVRNAPLSPFHSEEYQAWVHHFNYEDLKDDPRVWGTFIWLMFDFGADSRREGSRFGLNDKGLVGYDHLTRKDAFYFYKANWNPAPLLHLAGTRMTDTTNSVVTVMGFSNVGDVTFTLNGTAKGTKRPDGVNTVIWQNVPLVPGHNKIRLEAAGHVREAIWNRVCDSAILTP